MWTLRLDFYILWLRAIFVEKQYFIVLKQSLPPGTGTSKVHWFVNLG